MKSDVVHFTVDICPVYYSIIIRFKNKYVRGIPGSNVHIQSVVFSITVGAYRLYVHGTHVHRRR